MCLGPGERWGEDGGMAPGAPLHFAPWGGRRVRTARQCPCSLLHTLCPQAFPMPPAGAPSASGGGGLQDQLPTPADTRRELGLGVPGLPRPVLDHGTLGTEDGDAL